MSAYGFLSLRGAVPRGLSQTIHSPHGIWTRFT